MNEDLINSFLNEVNLQTDKTPPNSLFSPSLEEETQPKETEPAASSVSEPTLMQASADANGGSEKTSNVVAQPTFSFFNAAVEQAKQDSEERLMENLTAQNPYFQFSKALKEITDPNTTFEDLRVQNAEEYPELDAKDKEVKWTVVYGSTTKSIADPEKKVFEVKAQIEQSKDFLDRLKNAKKEADKKPVCYIKATVSFQKKGTAAKTILLFPTLEDAIASEKEVTYVPLKDNILYQVRNNDIGIFVAPVDDLPGQKIQDYRYFHFYLPVIPASLLLQVISFFQYVCKKDRAEVLTNILYDKVMKRYICDVPEQTISGFEVTANVIYDDSRYLHVMDIHSHNFMPAFFSDTDNQDELASRLYMVIGKLDHTIPQIKLRASCGGRFIPLDLEKVFDIQTDQYPFPKAWLDKLTIRKKPKICWPRWLKGVNQDA